jgi:hypothetical protein
MKESLRLLATAALTLVLSTTALAQPPTGPAAEAPPPVPRYQVEIVIFANRDFDRNEERFSGESAAALPEYEPLSETTLFDDTSFEPLEDTQPPVAVVEPEPTTDLPTQSEPEAFRFRLLRADELQLDTEYRRLQAIPAYLPLLHGGWVQQGLPEEQAEPIDLALLGAVNPRGTVRVYLSRFLHINLDLAYQEPNATREQAGPGFGTELGELPLAPRYRMVADRNARSGELHYFDHPAFGVLVRITPVPDEPADAAPSGKPAA